MLSYTESQTRINRTIKKFKLIRDEIIDVFCKKQDVVFDYWLHENSNSACFNNDFIFSFEDIYFDIVTNQPKGTIIKWFNEFVDYSQKTNTTIDLNYFKYTQGYKFSNLDESTKPSVADEIIELPLPIFYDSYGNSVHIDSEIIIESNYNYQSLNNQHAKVSFNSKNGVFEFTLLGENQIKTSFNFYGIHKFKVLK